MRCREVGIRVSYICIGVLAEYTCRVCDWKRKCEEILHLVAQGNQNTFFKLPDVNNEASVRSMSRAEAAKQSHMRASPTTS